MPGATGLVDRETTMIQWTQGPYSPTLWRVVYQTPKGYKPFLEPMTYKRAWRAWLKAKAMAAERGLGEVRFKLHKA